MPMRPDPTHSLLSVLSPPSCLALLRGGACEPPLGVSRPQRLAPDGECTRAMGRESQRSLEPHKAAAWLPEATCREGAVQRPGSGPSGPGGWAGVGRALHEATGRTFPLPRSPAGPSR